MGNNLRLLVIIAGKRERHRVHAISASPERVCDFVAKASKFLPALAKINLRPKLSLADRTGEVT